MAAMSHVAVAREGQIARVRLNRPEVGNAMSDVTLRELTAAFRAAGDARAVIVTGEGKHFCAGADIEWMKKGGGKDDARLLVDMLSAVQECPAPVIVAAHGAVYGGGLGLLAACDVAVVAENARFCFSEVKLGIMPAVISCFVLPKIGVANARRYYLTAEVFDAAAALRMGLAHEIASVERAGELAALICQNGPQAVRTAKKLLLDFEGWTPEQRVENVLETLVRLRQSPEGQEGFGAFLEKRRPRW